jgi:hypothetical protein
MMLGDYRKGSPGPFDPFPTGFADQGMSEPAPVTNAYVKPLTGRYLSKLAGGWSHRFQGKLFIMLSSGVTSLRRPSFGLSNPGLPRRSLRSILRNTLIFQNVLL